MIPLTISLLTATILGLLLAMIAISLYVADVLERRRLEGQKMTPLEQAILNHIAENNRNER